MPKLGISRAITAVAVVVGAMALYSAPAYAAEGAPIVTTGKTSLVRQLTSTYAGGSIEPNGATTNARIEYGKTVSYGSQTKDVNVGSSGWQSIFPFIVGLSEGTTYHYRVSATNKFGTSYGVDKTFTTAQWHIGGKTLTELGGIKEKYVSTGSFGFSIPGLGVVAEGCKETGHGTLGSEEQMTLTGCRLNGTPECEVDPISLSLDGSFKSTLGEILMVFYVHPPCGWYESTTVSGSEGFALELTTAEKSQLPLSMAGQAKFGTNPVNLWGSSTWELSGANAGKKFGAW